MNNIIYRIKERKRIKNLPFQTDIQKQVFDEIMKLPYMRYHGYTGTIFIKSQADKFVDLKKPNSYSQLVQVLVLIFQYKHEEYKKFGVEIKINMTFNSSYEEEPVFQGWVESIEELKTILKTIGL